MSPSTNVTLKDRVEMDHGKLSGPSGKLSDRTVSGLEDVDQLKTTKLEDKVRTVNKKNGKLFKERCLMEIHLVSDRDRNVSGPTEITGEI